MRALCDWMGIQDTDNLYDFGLKDQRGNNQDNPDDTSNARGPFEKTSIKSGKDINSSNDFINHINSIEEDMFITDENGSTYIKMNDIE